MTDRESEVARVTQEFLDDCSCSAERVRPITQRIRRNASQSLSTLLPILDRRTTILATRLLCPSFMSLSQRRGQAVQQPILFTAASPSLNMRQWLRAAKDLRGPLAGAPTRRTRRHNLLCEGTRGSIPGGADSDERAGGPPTKVTQRRNSRRTPLNCCLRIHRRLRPQNR